MHIPFCLSVCPYCDFVVYGGRLARGPDTAVDRFLRALHVELELRADLLEARFGPRGEGRAPLGSVYLGGGTPSLLPGREIAALLEHIERRFGLATDVEVTLELNPGPGERGDAAGQRAAGVTRLSIGAQSLEPGELRALGRRHAPADILITIDAARSAGFRSVSVDLLYDIPGQTAETWGASLHRVLDAGVDHVSTYALTLDDPDGEGLTGPLGDHLPVSAGARRWRERARAGQDEDRAADLYEQADTTLASAGLEWYEISNWAKAGHESRHNLAYWRGDAWEALGPGAHAFDGAFERRWNAAPLDRYLEALATADASEARLPGGGTDRLDARLAFAEGAILGLRTRTGISPTIASKLDTPLRWASAAGLIESTAGGWRHLTLRGRLLGNELFGRILVTG